jgi:hypothetical protein
MDRVCAAASQSQEGPGCTERLRLWWADAGPRSLIRIAIVLGANSLRDRTSARGANPSRSVDAPPRAPYLSTSCRTWSSKPREAGTSTRSRHRTARRGLRRAKEARGGKSGRTCNPFHTALTGQLNL